MNSDKLESDKRVAHIFGQIQEIEYLLKGVTSPDDLQAIRGRLTDTERRIENRRKGLAKKVEVFLQKV